MEYLQTYEGFFSKIKKRGERIRDSIKDKIRYSFKYKKDDFIYFESDLIDYYEKKPTRLAKIIEPTKDEIHGLAGESPVYIERYVVKLLNGKFYKINQDDIKRKLTPEEVEEYKLGIEMKKFNL